MKLRTMSWISGACLGLCLVACNGSTDSDPPAGGGSNDIASGYLYLGACTPDACAALPVPEIGCAEGQPEYVCSARTGNECSITVTCPGASDADRSVSFGHCEDAECGPKPGTPAEACPAGYEWGGSTCGSLDGAACAWANGCYEKKEPITVDPNAVGKACGVDVQCDAPQSCAVMPPETGIEGAHCYADPCAALQCPGECIIQESYPGQVRCL